MGNLRIGLIIENKFFIKTAKIARGKVFAKAAKKGIILPDRKIQNDSMFSV